MAVNPSIQLGTSGNWAIKEDNLLAYKQLGNKFFDREFDFSRGTRATFVGRNGLIQESGLTDTELVTNGDFATDSNWVKNGGATISGGQANIVGDGTSFTSIVQYSIFTIGKKYEVSVDVTISSGLGLKFQDGTNNESIGFATTSGTYVFYFTGTSSADFVIGRRTGGTAFNSSVNNVSIKEIQLDVPRIDFTDDPTGHLLLEPQSTNLWRNSEGSDITLTSPLGTFGFYNITSSQASNSEVFTAGTIVSATFIVKKADGTTPTITASGSPGDIIFRITGSSGAGVAGALTDIGNGFYTYKLENYSVSGNNQDNRISNNSGDVVYVSLVQLEQKSYPTSYIPTSGSAVTRNQEICNNSGTVNDFNSEEGVLYAEIAALVDVGTSRRISLSDGTSSNRLFIDLRAATNQMRVEIVVGSGVFALLADIDKTIFNKIAFSYKSGDSSLFINGVKISNSTSSFVFNNNLSKLSFDNGFGGDNFYGKTKNVKAFKRALTDTELQELTT